MRGISPECESGARRAFCIIFCNPTTIAPASTVLRKNPVRSPPGTCGAQEGNRKSSLIGVSAQRFVEEVYLIATECPMLVYLVRSRHCSSRGTFGRMFVTVWAVRRAESGGFSPPSARSCPSATRSLTSARLIATVFSARVASLLDVVENVSNHAGPGRQRGSNACYLRLCPCSSENRCSSVSLVSKQ